MKNKFTALITKREIKGEIDTEKQKEIMSTGKANILVVVRCRPLSKKELELSNIETVKIVNEKVVFILDPADMTNNDENPLHRSKEQQYAFDYAFDKGTQQQQIYDNAAKFLLSGIVDGFNATLFAYGATGAGKTHTMLGSDTEPGVMVRSLADLFSIIQNTTNQIKVKLTYIEIYNETLKDLLSNGETLDLREDPIKGSVLVGVSELEVNNSTEVFKLLLKGNKNRTTEATNMNETSSRSHAVLQILVENKKSLNEITSGKLILVDLAGSERASNSKNTGLRLIEGGNINKSLLALGNCINALADINSGLTKNFIPWRDSKLTRMLKDSLIGNSRIVMIANISPSIFSIEDSLNTLKYANRAKNIKSNIKRNVLDVDYHLNKYDDLISNLKNEIEDLRQQVASKIHDQHLIKISESNNGSIGNKIEKLNKEMSLHFKEEINIKREIIDEEKRIENMNTDLKEKEFLIFKYSNDKHNSSKIKDIKKYIGKLNEQINSIKSSLDIKVSNYNELQKKRENFLSQINAFNKDPLYNALNMSYQYFIIVLNNISLDQKKNQNLNELKAKEMKMNKYINQIKVRDEYIKNIDNELKKRSIKVSYNDDIKTLSDICTEQNLILPPINAKMEDNKIIVNNIKPINKNFSKSASPKIRLLNYEDYNNPYILKEKKKFKTKTTELINKSKKNQLTSFKINLINELYPNSKIKYTNLNNVSVSNDKLIEFKAYNLMKEKNNISMNSNQSSHSQSRLEREIDKKSRFILQRNIVSRYKNSPYINKAIK